MHFSLPAAILAAVIVFMIAEAVVSLRHERKLRAAGAVEPPGDVFPIMRVAYPASFVAMAIEGTARSAATPRWLLTGGIVFVAAKALKYWAISTLGTRWSFRVLVLPGKPLIVAGPYRYLRHPNYVGIAGEIVGFAIMLSAPISGVVSLLVNGLLIARRVTVEERALGLKN